MGWRIQHEPSDIPVTADAAGVSERERLREAMRGNITYASIERGDVDDLLDAILAAGFGDVARAKAEALRAAADQIVATMPLDESRAAVSALRARADSYRTPSTEGTP